jgi:PTS system nitrogen regulatory IIA component
MNESADEAGFPVIDLPPEADTPEAAVRFLIAKLVCAGRLCAAAADEVSRQVWQRERFGSTAIGGGVAIPHAQIRAVPAPVGVVGRCALPLHWPGAVDGGTVALVCLVVIPAGSEGHLLRELHRLARQLRGDSAAS